MIKKIFRTIWRVLPPLLAVTLITLLLPRLITALHASKRTYTISEAPARRVAVVFGAGLWRDGSPTPILRDRVETAAQLYFAGKVEKILMSGDNRFVDYNEPAAMRDYALGLGVPDTDIVLDYAGRRTYDTCYRAKAIFGVTDPILVTQAFHLDRALFTCDALGLNAIGVPATNRSYRRSLLFYWNLRDTAATFTAFWEVYISHPVPVLGEPLPIFPAEDA